MWWMALVFAGLVWAESDLPRGKHSAMPDFVHPEKKRQLKSAEKPHMISEIASAKCLTAVSDKNMDQVLGQWNIDINEDAKNSEKLVLAKMVKTLGESVGKTQDDESWIEWTMLRVSAVLPVRSDGGCLPGKQTVIDTRPAILFARSCPADSAQGAMRIPLSGATMVHEFGHVVANRADLYPEYDTAVSEACEVSTYCVQSSAGIRHSNRHEEFAEVFAAYVFVPNRLRAECPEAFRFMKQRVFVKGDPICAMPKGKGRVQ